MGRKPTGRPVGRPRTIGMKMGRTWALVHGSSWVLASDLIQAPGIFASYATWQSCQRALARAQIFPEEMYYDGRAKLYRLDPGVVEGLLQWGTGRDNDPEDV